MKIKKVKNNKMAFKLPDRFNNKSVNVIIIPSKKEKSCGIFALAGSLDSADAEIMANSVDDSRKIERDNW